MARSTHMTEFVIMQADGSMWRVVSRHITELRAITRLQKIARPGETYMIVEVRLTYAPREG